MELDYLLVTFEAPLSPLMTQLLRPCQGRSRRSCRSRWLRSTWSRTWSRTLSPKGLDDDGLMTSQDVLQGFAQIAQQMEPVRDLHCVGRALAGRFGISPGTITAD